MAVYFAAPTFLRQGVVAGFVLSAPDYSGTPPGAGTPISFTFQNANITVSGVTIDIATGYQHWVSIGGAVFSYVQQNGDTAATVATYLGNAINSAADALATATSAGGILTLSPRQNTGAAIDCTASDGATAQTLFELTGNELIPSITRGVLFAQGIMYNPAVAPVLPAAPASQQSWLFYSSTGGWYWKNSAAPNNATDACVGWVVTTAASVIAISSRRLGSGAEEAIIPAGPGALLLGSAGEDTGVPPAINFTAAETNAQLVIGGLTLASSDNTAEIAFAEFLLYYVNELAGTTLTLTGALTSGATAMSASGTLPASAPGSVTFTFSAVTVGSVTIGPGYVHSIGVGAATYEYEQQTEDTAAGIALALADAINANADPNAYATASGAAVKLTALQNTGGTVTCSASDGNTPQTLTETEPTFVTIDQEIVQVNAASGATIVRGALGSTAAAHTSGAKIWPVTTQTMVFAIPLFSYGTPNWPTVVGQIPFAGQALVAATGWVANEIGPSPITTKCFTGQGPYAVDAEGNPLAPDVAGFTAMVTTNIQVAGQPYYQFSGTVTVGPAPGSTPEIDVVMTSAAGVATVVYRFMGPFTPSAALNWTSVVFPEPTSGPSLVFQPTVTPLNIDGVATVSTYTVGTLMVPNGTVSAAATPPEAPYSVVLSETGPRTLRLSDQTTYTTLKVVIEEAITPASGFSLGTGLHVQVSSDGGSTWGDAIAGGTYAPDRVDEDSTHTYFVTSIGLPQILVYTTAQSYRVRVWTLNQYVDNGTPGAVLSNVLTVSAIGTPSFTGATLAITAVSNVGPDPTTGWQYWQQTLTVQTPGGADANCAWYFLTAQNCDAGGNPGPANTPSAQQSISVERQAVTFPNDGQVHVLALSGGYLPAGSTYTYSRWRVYGVSRTANAPQYSVTGGSWASGVATLTIGAHAFTVGNTAYIQGILPDGYNGIVTITAVTGTTISYASPSSPGYSGLGTVNQPGWEDPTYSAPQQWPGTGLLYSLQDFGAAPIGAIPSGNLIGLGPGFSQTNLGLTVQTPGQSIILNSGFELFSLSGNPADWALSNGATVSTALANGGTHSLLIPNPPAAFTTYATSLQITSTQLDLFSVVGFWYNVQLSGGATFAGTISVSITFYDSSNTQIGSPLGTSALVSLSLSSPSWAKAVADRAGAQAPAGTAYMVVTIAADNLSGSSSGVQVFIDDVLVVRGASSAQLGVGAVQSAHLATASVTTTALATASVGIAALAAGAVTNAALAAGAVTNAALAVAAVQSGNMDTGAVNPSNGALAAGAYVFTADVAFSRGSGQPIVYIGTQASVVGVYLFGASASGGASGLTSQAYLAIQYSGALWYGGNTGTGGVGPAVQINGSAITLWSVNGNSAYPYIQITGFTLAISQGTLSLALNGVTTTIQNQNIGGTWGTTGLQCQQNSTLAYAAVTPNVLGLQYGAASSSDSGAEIYFLSGGAPGGYPVTAGATSELYAQAGTTSTWAAATLTAAYSYPGAAASVELSFTLSAGPYFLLSVQNGLTSIALSNLPTASPGSGSKQLWADSSDSYRVKYAF